jgi:D-aspartate ligase
VCSSDLALCVSPRAAVMNSGILNVVATEGFERAEIFVPTLLARLREGRAKGKIQLVIPCADEYTDLLSRHYDAFEGLIGNRFIPPELLDKFGTKASFYALCEEQGLDYPRTVIIEKSDRTRGLELIKSAGIAFPIVLKPNNSNSYEYLHCRFEGKKKVYFLDTPAQYDALIAAMATCDYADLLIVQERIEGGDDMMRVVNAYCDERSRVRLIAAGQPILEEYAPGTLGNYAAILSTTEADLCKKIADFLLKIGYVGFANFDIKYDGRSGRFVFFEINPRPGRSSYFVRAAGGSLVGALVGDIAEALPYEGMKTVDSPALWTSVSMRTLRKYVRNHALQARIKTLRKAGRVHKTLINRRERSPLRMLRIARYYWAYDKNIGHHFFEK